MELYFLLYALVLLYGSIFRHFTYCPMYSVDFESKWTGYRATGGPWMKSRELAQSWVDHCNKEQGPMLPHWVGVKPAFELRREQ